MSILTFLRQMIANQWMAFFLTLFSIFLSIYGAKKLPRFKRISYRKRSIEIKRGIMCTEANNKCRRREEKLYVTQIAIWNSGTKYINNVDFAQKLPLKVMGHEECKIKDCYLIYQNNEVNNLNLQLDEKENETIIDFDFLDKGDGCVINVVTEGNPDMIKIDGFIKGGRKIQRSLSTFETFTHNKYLYNFIMNKYIGIIIIFYGIFMCPIAYLQSANYHPIMNNFFNFQGRLAYAADCVLIISLILFSVCSIIPFVYKLFSPNMPQNIKRYFDDNNER